MPAIALMNGPNAILQNVVYSVPGRAKWCISGAALEIGALVGGPFVAVPATATTGAVLTGGTFVRCTTGNTNLVLSNH